MLCEHRPEGFGPRSAFSSHLPTICFADVVVVPLATWLYLIILLIVLPLCLLSLRASASASAVPSHTAGAPTAGDKVAVSTSASTSMPPATKSTSVVVKIASIIYYVLIVGMLAMASLEIARLIVAQLGIGLLPFTYVGILAALVLHVAAASTTTTSWLGGLHVYRGEARWRWTVKGVNILYWVMLMCVMAIKVASQAKEQNALGIRTGQQAQYPISDSITDNAAMIGVEFVLLILELLTI
ncbi:hypothetical protein JMJ77_0006106 [Colletotrichum scovillei]|uniref:Uncharacterized protein n=1 Tax=Colletotrichum scovillei TaxID=1209932 RepID=A0A9P7UIW8_9PEZI|nr:hypothetical protein JMJ77_0006106 [Colletotrichum scovillei]KAG7077337.1 hypothetical protein JMJ76_0014585 [Colletotrichum scovillei]KAG7084454.1 hypothetical protein JMJ78_0009889 [Colletotrichum scovillei]